MENKLFIKKKKIQKLLPETQRAGNVYRSFEHFGSYLPKFWFRNFKGKLEFLGV
jgi:hypothetical protein